MAKKPPAVSGRKRRFIQQSMNESSAATGRLPTGALQPETWTDASSLGMGVGASATYNAQNAGATYAAMAFASANMARSVRGQSMSFVADNIAPRHAEVWDEDSGHPSAKAQEAYHATAVDQHLLWRQQ